MADIKIERLKVDDNVSLSIYNDKILIDIKGTNKLAIANYTYELFEIIKTVRLYVPRTLERIKN